MAGKPKKEIVDGFEEQLGPLRVALASALNSKLVAQTKLAIVDEMQQQLAPVRVELNKAKRAAEMIEGQIDILLSTREGILAPKAAPAKAAPPAAPPKKAREAGECVGCVFDDDTCQQWRPAIGDTSCKNFKPGQA